MDIKSGCYGKKAHETHAEALSVARLVRNRTKVYRCAHCGMWHVGAVWHSYRKSWVSERLEWRRRLRYWDLQEQYAMGGVR
jgi:hypothetical protein